MLSIYWSAIVDVSISGNYFYWHIEAVDIGIIFGIQNGPVQYYFGLQIENP